MNDALIVSALSAVPKNRVARLVGRSARLRLPRALHRALVRWFVARYRVDLGECEGGIDDFVSLADFFVRPLRPGVRPVDPDPGALTSPVDATVHTFGEVLGGTFLQAPGRPAPVADLLGGADEAIDPSRWEGGSYAVLYLSPRDYHRVHAPSNGSLVAWRYLPGQLWPVFPAATRRVDGLFGRNERLVFVFETALGLVAQVMVGAFGVGRMTSSLAPIAARLDATNAGRGRISAAAVPPATVERAQEVGRFELGSTVILFAEPGCVRWELAQGAPVRLGQAISRAARAPPVSQGGETRGFPPGPPFQPATASGSPEAKLEFARCSGVSAGSSSAAPPRHPDEAHQEGEGAAR